MSTCDEILSQDALIDILLFCYDDLKSVMNFAVTCKTFHEIITKCSERLWIYILENKFMQQRRIGGRKKIQSKPLFKKTTLSILENDIGLSDKSKQLISIIRTQIRFDRKYEILKGYYEERDMAKYKYFRQLEKLNIKDELIWKLVKREQNESLKLYSPENIIKEKFNNNPCKILDLNNHNSWFSIKELIDALFRKENAYLELDIHNRRISSYLYDFWKQNYGSNIAKNEHELINFRYHYTCCRDVNDCLLFIKLVYLEFPNSKKKALNEFSLETAFEEEKHSPGAFKRMLHLFLHSIFKNENMKRAVDLFAQDLYGTIDVNHK